MEILIDLQGPVVVTLAICVWAFGVLILAVNVWVGIVLPAVNRKIASNIAFCSVMSALCVVLMIICRIVSITDYAISAVCGLLIGVVVIELGKKWAFATYVVASLLGILLGSSECVVTFVVLIGYYPIVKVCIDKFNTIISFVIKLALFNIMVIGAYFLLDLLGFIPLDEIRVLGKYTNVVILVLANVVFVLYDFAFNGVMNMYYVKFHSKISNIIKK